MKLTDGVQDAVKLAQNLHRQVKALKDSIDELEYLICEIDERCKLGFFDPQGKAWDNALVLDEFADWEGEKNDKGRCKKGTATD